MKLLQLLNSLSKEELKLLRKAVTAPLYTTNAKVVQLFKLLRPQYPDFDFSEKGKSKLYKKIYDSAKYNDYKLRRLFSELTQVIEDFLIFQDLEQEKLERQKLLITAYNKRGLYTFFKKETADILKKLKETPYRDVAYYEDKVQLLKANYFHSEYDRYDIKENTLAELSTTLDTYFSLSKVQLALLLKNEENLINRQYTYSFLPEVQEESTKASNKSNNLLQLYIQSYYLLTEETEIDFARFENQLFHTFQDLEGVDKQIIFKNGLNYVIKRFNQGIPFFDNELNYKWNLFGLENDIFLYNGKISEANFSNLIIIGIQTGRFDWVNQFIEDYQAIVESKDIDKLTTFYQGIIAFGRKDFEKVLLIYSSFQVPTRVLVQVRGLILRALFELYLTDDTYFETLNSNLQSFDIYLKRNEFFSPKTLLRFVNFLKIFRPLLTKIIRSESPNVIKKWFQEQLKSQPLYAKNWLIEKVDNL